MLTLIDSRWISNSILGLGMELGFLGLHIPNGNWALLGNGKTDWCYSQILVVPMGWGRVNTHPSTFGQVMWSTNFYFNVSRFKGKYYNFTLYSIWQPCIYQHSFRVLSKVFELSFNLWLQASLGVPVHLCKQVLHNLNVMDS